MLTQAEIIDSILNGVTESDLLEAELLMMKEASVVAPGQDSLEAQLREAAQSLRKLATAQNSPTVLEEDTLNLAAVGLAALKARFN